jgi:hypothetical protein
MATYDAPVLSRGEFHGPHPNRRIAVVAFTRKNANVALGFAE